MGSCMSRRRGAMAALLVSVAASGVTAASAQTTDNASAASPAKKAMVKKTALKAEALRKPASEDIIVTGSALGLRANENANPVQVVTAKDIQQTSAVTLGDYLQRLPSIGSSAQQNTEPNGGVGMSCTDIRNLGTTRVLVLVDGKRQVQTFGNGGSCVNLNSIPIDQIASVEILKDGGSELYGADAVSGVINIKLKHDLTGAGIDVRGGISDRGDGQTGQISAYKGMNFDHGRGNITLFGSYMTQSSIMQRNRNWARNVWLGDPEIGSQPSFGTSLTPQTRVIDSSGSLNLISNGTGGGPNGFNTYSTADNYNYALRQSLTNGLQRSSLSGDAHYDLNDHVTLYSTVRYTHQTGFNAMAPLGITGASYPSTLPSSIILPAGSPYNMWGEDVDLYKRFANLGDRRFSEAYDTWQVISGAKGRIIGDWYYDLSMTYGASRSTIQTENMVNYKHLMQELGVEQLDPSDSSSAVVYNPSVCQASAGCSLVNPFAPFSSQALNYIRYTQRDHAMYQLRDFNARVHNNHVAHLPYAHGGDFGLAFGMEHRGEQANYSPDPLAENGDLGGGSSYTGGGYNVTSAYIEGKLTLLQDGFLARNLTIDGQGRWTHYNTFGDTYNWKASINWQPIKDIRFRATLGTSFRAPSISELYAGQGLGYYAGTDPCEAASSYGAYAANVVARCTSEGLNTATFKNANTGTLPELGGGNPSLKPEISRNYTIGTVITPRWVPGLMIDVDYWHYSIQNMVGTLGGQYILDECYTGQNTAYCSYIAPRSSSGQLTQINITNQNLGGLRTSGIDFNLTYMFRLGRHDSVRINNNFQQLISYLQQSYAGGPWYNYAGRLFYLGGTSGNPRVRDYLSATWMHGDFSFTYMMNYTGGMIYNDGTSDVSCKQYAYCSVPGIFAHDVTVNYRLGHWNFEGGVNNLFDKKPPFVASASANTAPGLYSEEIIGRYVFLDVSTKF